MDLTNGVEVLHFFEPLVRHFSLWHQLLFQYIFYADPSILCVCVCVYVCVMQYLSMEAVMMFLSTSQ